MNPNDTPADIVVVGAGIAGLAAAYYLTAGNRKRRVVLLDPRPPMSLTSAQSGENYRDWWPHPVMAAFSRSSIARMAELVRRADRPIRMTRNGYLLATRRPADALAGEWVSGLADPEDLRRHETLGGYPRDAFSGLDVLSGRAVGDLGLPGLDPSVQTLIHVRCGGQIDSQQLGQHMLDKFRAAGGVRRPAKVLEVSNASPFRLSLSDGTTLKTEVLVLAPGPFINALVAQFQAPLPISHVLQQKLAFPDVHGIVPRSCPFLIDLDRQTLNFSAEEQQALREEPELAWLCEEFPGGIHCRPDGAGNWIKMGWAFNTKPSAPEAEPALGEHFSEVVLRGASRLQPGLAAYTERLPREAVHYGGYYSTTEENWPLIGPLEVEGAFVVGALSGFGTMAACEAGALIAGWVDGGDLPAYARSLSPRRYRDSALISALKAAPRGIL